MLLFLLILLFIIVKFRTFNAKIIGAQALVWILILLIISQFFFVQGILSKVLTSITFLFVSIAGYYLVRSVKQVDIQKELLEQANQNQQSLLHFITHQVKGYMTKTRNIFDGLLAGDYGPIHDQKMKDIIKYGFDSETKGVETIQAILRASDLKTGRTDFKKEMTNISVLVAELSEKANETAQNKGLDFSFDIEPNVIVSVDPLRIGEVFKNLIDNALTYTPRGEVRVSLKTEGDNVRFAVFDTGCGLTDEDKTRLFTEGGKGKDAMRINIDSTGYGLFIAKKIVEQHNGKIGAHSDGRDKGSEFFVILPKMQ
jgi:signal transduction histidine kinase